MEFGAELIGMVKKNTKGLCKDNIENIKNDWPEGSHLVFRSKPTIPGGRLLLDIGNKYNEWKVLSFIVTDNKVITNAVLTYLSKYTDQFNNVAILPVSRPLVVSKFFGSVNEAESHNRSKKHDLALEKFWVNQCGWIRLCMIIDMGMTITNGWKPFVMGLRDTTMKN